ncbi:MAG: D-alanyl-D-alanine carboxypeptidase [Coriobacteriales bacterium]|jgi:D-alanyl-D-alanine carboxypeptidase (penicillin-binding protein 5/6)|nr:D-alanyl-D-alanine carboxypeptidase [Coriobacteriales bacterium]
MLAYTYASMLSSTAFADVRASDIVNAEPLGEGHPAIPDAPDVVADYAALCSKDGLVLWERDAYTQVPMASTTKIMTAVVALENAAPDTPMLVTYGAANTEGSTADLREGDTALLRDLIVCMMVPSGNDASVAIAENIAGTEFAFVNKMNDKAAELGMSGTHFSNASGLTDEDNYTTVADYLLLTRLAMGDVLFRETVAASEVTAKVNGETVSYYSTNKLLDEMPGANGVKTGFTDEAGYCLVASAKRGNFELYAVVFHASDEDQRFADARALLEWGFAHYRTVEFINASKPVANLALLSWIDETVPVGVAAPVSANIFDYAGEVRQEVTLIEKEGPVRKGEMVGSLTWTQNAEVLATIDLLAMQDVSAPGFWEGVGIWWQRLFRGWLGDPVHATSTTTLPEVFPLEIAQVGSE